MLKERRASGGIASKHIRVSGADDLEAARRSQYNLLADQEASEWLSDSLCVNDQPIVNREGNTRSFAAQKLPTVKGDELRKETWIPGEPPDNHLIELRSYDLTLGLSLFFSHCFSLQVLR
jgi:hypothetical protein